MNTRARHRILVTAAVASVSALALAGCSGNTGDSGEGSADEQVTLTVTTFGTFGYEDLYKEYEKAHPNVKIEATNIDTGGNARTDAFTKIAAGSGLSDVVAIEEGWLGAIMDVSDTFVDLRDYGIEDRKDDWVDWKYGQATDAEGRVIGYGTDIGPSGICYNGAAFEAAGLPSDRESVAELLNGDWENYFAVGADYTAKTGKAWYDHSGFVWNAMVNQLDEGYYAADGTLNVEDNAELKERFELLGAATEGGQSAAQTAWDWNGGKSFVDGTFATFVCPGWMLGVVQGQVEAGGGDASTGWDFADVFPEAQPTGAVRSCRSRVVAAQEGGRRTRRLADAARAAGGAVRCCRQLPSTIKAQETLAADATPNAFFNDAPTGAILAERAKGVVAQFKGADDSVIQENVFGPALSSLDRRETDTQGAWDQAVGLLNDLVG